MRAVGDLKIDQSRDGLHEKWNAQYMPMDLPGMAAFIPGLVINRTGFQGSYDFDLAFTDEPSADAGPLEQTGPSLFDAVQSDALSIVSTFHPRDPWVLALEEVGSQVVTAGWVAMR